MKLLARSLPVFLIGLILFTSCGGGNRYEKSPLDVIVRDIPREVPMTVILHDMDAQGNFAQTYYHQYQIIKEENGDVKEEVTDWFEVSEREFNAHINDMGMEIAARDTTGNLTKTVAPPGYSNYVGNTKYGSWQTHSNGSSFWAFYGQYAFMSSMFRMATYPAYYGHYNNWRGSYYGTGRSYYGPTTGGRSYYGTNSAYNSSRSTNWNSKPSSFRNKVASRTARSSSRTGTSAFKSSSSRSRGGSFGK
ncbi:MAG: hypothetical protein JXQ90_06520 [Cyclobacteriaceae bacterium]